MSARVDSARLVRATDLVGLPVVTLGGDDIAEVRDVVYDRSEGSLVGFTLNGRGFLSGRIGEVLGTDSITAIGQDAVMVADGAALAEPGEAPAQVAEASDDGEVIGTSVITEEGQRLGRVADVIVSLGADPHAVGYELTEAPSGDSAFVPFPDQLALSGDALMVPAELEHLVRDDTTGFGGALAEFRSKGDRGGRSKGGMKPRGSESTGGETKAELYERAKARDIPGRGSMTKAELETALREKGSA